MHHNKVPLKNLTAVALPHLNPMIWPVVPESGELFLSPLQVSALSVWHTHGMHHRSPALNWVDLRQMKCFTCKNNNNPACTMVLFSCQKINRIHTHIFCKGYWDTAGGGEPWKFKTAVGIKMFPDVLRYAAVIGPEEDTVWKIVRRVELTDWQLASQERPLYNLTSPIKLYTDPLYLFQMSIWDEPIKASCQSTSRQFIMIFFMNSNKRV